MGKQELKSGDLISLEGEVFETEAVYRSGKGDDLRPRAATFRSRKEVVSKHYGNGSTFIVEVGGGTTTRPVENLRPGDVVTSLAAEILSIKEVDPLGWILLLVPVGLVQAAEDRGAFGFIYDGSDFETLPSPSGPEADEFAKKFRGDEEIFEDFEEASTPSIRADAYYAGDIELEAVLQRPGTASKRIEYAEPDGCGFRAWFENSDGEVVGWETLDGLYLVPVIEEVEDD